jgi:hypothetical protein
MVFAHQRAALLGFVFIISSASAQSTKLDVQDVSFLWPVPKTTDDVNNLISAAEELVPGKELFPSEVFAALIKRAESTEMITETRAFRISFPDPSFRQSTTWKVAGIRIDASAPGSHQSVIDKVGSRPQIRLVLQPVTIRDNQPEIHDFAAHLVYDFVLPSGGNSVKGIPNVEVFKEIVGDLLKLKAELIAQNIPTGGPLGVHPAFKSGVAGFTDRLRALLRNHLSKGAVNTVAFMGIERPEPWMFFSLGRSQSGAFVDITPPSIANQATQMFTKFPGISPNVIPVPTPRTFGSMGVATSVLFEESIDLEKQVFPQAADTRLETIKVKDIPAIIANPAIANVLTTDCVSCHTETRRRMQLGIADSSLFEFQRSDGISGISDDVLPKSDWNVHNFGWFKSSPTVTRRTANEAAESVAFINEKYVGRQSSEDAQAPETPASNVANPLTLIMTIKSEADFIALKGIIEQMQALPPSQNPINQAMTEIGTVHFARFVFIDNTRLAVITTYDGNFDEYIMRFVDKIGHIFDLLLVHMKDAPPTPVREHAAEFLAYISKNDLKSVGPLYSAYPKLTTQEILKIQKKASSN